MGKFFSLREDVLVHEFDGTVEELKAKFESDKVTQRESMQEQIKAQEERKTKLVRPENYDTRTRSEQIAIDADIAAKVAHCDNQINKINSMIEFLGEMKFEDQKFFDLESLLVK